MDWLDGLTAKEQKEFREWVKHQVDEVLPHMRDSAAIVSLLPTSTPDMKFCVELGMAIMLDKPIIIVSDVNREIPEKLRLIADEIIVADMSNPDGVDKAAREISQLAQRFQ